MAGLSDRLRLGATGGLGSAPMCSRAEAPPSAAPAARHVTFDVDERRPGRRSADDLRSSISKFTRLAEPEEAALAPAPRLKGLPGLIQRYQAKKAEKAQANQFAAQLLAVLGASERRGSRRTHRDFKVMSKDMVDVNGKNCTGAVIEMAAQFLSARMSQPGSYFERAGAAVADRRVVLYKCITDPASRRHLINIAAIHSDVTLSHSKNVTERALVDAALDSGKVLFENKLLSGSADLTNLIESILGHVYRQFQYLTSQQRSQLVRDVLWRPDQIKALYPALQPALQSVRSGASFLDEQAVQVSAPGL
jgi:hypothetical protein